MSPDETVAILDFGSQYTQLIARRVRESHVYCEILPYDASPSHWERLKPKGCILSGGPASVYEEGAPRLPSYLLRGGNPILGICYGMQLLAQELGGRVAAAKRPEYGPAELRILDPTSPLFAGLPSPQGVWMSHGDQVEELPSGFRALARTDNSPLAAMGDDERQIYGLQFHPEVAHTLHGKEIIANFLQICGCQGTWNAGSFIEESTKSIREQVGKERVLCALSGGVDSLVTATLIGRAVGEQLASIFVDHGLLRQGEAEANRALFQRLDMKVGFVAAQERFLARLKGVQEPEVKRQIIGEEFIRVFEEEARRLGPFPFLAQGTLYPDLIESTSPHSQAAARIKSHHNVAGLPQEMAFSLVEPLRYLFKDEVREAGLALGLPEEVVRRQPFPGPGLAIRIIGEVTRERLQTLRAADAIVEEEIKRARLYRGLWQSFALLTPVRSVGVMGDHRTYENVVVIRAVESEDGMTARWAHLPYDFLERMASRIVNEVAGVNRVAYDITSKPPATIEWE